MDGTRIKNVLLAMGVPAGIKGYTYITDAVEYIDKYGTDISATRDLYPEIAKKRGTTASRVERAIRHAFEIARSSKGDYEVVEKYIEFMNCTNFSSIVMLHDRIDQECDFEQTEEPKQSVTKTQVCVNELEIREIIRQELRMFMNDLRKLMYEPTKTDA